IIEKNSFDDILNKHAIIFSGSGVLKSENLITGKHALFSHNSLKAEGMALLSGKKFSLQEVGNSFDTIALYIKEFYTM
ncbi:MAG: hypothetical protein H0W12_12055, partial [Chitinophagaceae bacterium]|nr:hypothetical protein [Chitinophagaceae bacterium]